MSRERPAAVPLLLPLDLARGEFDFLFLVRRRDIVIEQPELIRIDRLAATAEQPVAPDSKFRNQFVDAL